MIYFRNLFVFLFSSFLFYSSSLYAQSTPSISGFSCSVTNAPNDFFSSDTRAEGIGIACANFCAGFGQCSLVSSSASGCQVISNQSGQQVTLGGGCNVTAVCLTGTGFEPADSGGFCPDPDPSDDEGDDDDGDGSDCDEGEGSALDCNDGDGDDTDTDGDGEPDSEDDDDGICNEFNEGDLDCDGSCDSQDTSNSTDCSGGSCPEGDLNQLGIFDVSQSFNIPQEVCAANGCLHRWPDTQLDCTPSNGDLISCIFEQTGTECPFCTEPSCSSSECPVGQSRDSETLNCEDIPDFCEIDNNNDGVPDNEGSFACDEDGECDPDDEDCQEVDRVDVYACEEQPPVCPSDASAVDCAILQQTHALRCSAVITQSATCDVEFNCELTDPALCAIAHTNYLSLCRNLIEDSEVDVLESILNPTGINAAVDAGDYFYNEVSDPAGITDLDQIQLENERFTLNGNLESKYTANLTSLNSSVTIDLEQGFTLLDFIGLLVVLSSSIAAFKIVTRAHTA